MTPSFRPRLALPFTLLPAAGAMHLVGGEDVRYTLAAPDIETWLPPLLLACDGRNTLEQLLDQVHDGIRGPAADAFQRLYDERALIDGTALDAHIARVARAVIAGAGRLADAMAAVGGGGEGKPLRVFCQDGLDFGEVLTFNRERRAAGEPWIWTTLGPVQRGYVSPVFLPHTGPCCGCLLNQFRRRSPAPEFYDLLQRRERQELSGPPNGALTEAVGILVQLVAWKLRQLGHEQPSSALYRLHVLEMANMEVSTHRILIDPDCSECRRGSVG